MIKSFSESKLRIQTLSYLISATLYQLSLDPCTGRQTLKLSFPPPHVSQVTTNPIIVECRI